MRNCIRMVIIPTLCVFAIICTGFVCSAERVNQFSSMWNGRVDKCFADDDICQLVEEELQSRTNVDTIFFTAGGYGKYGTPMFQVGNHYFSSYE